MRRLLSASLAALVLSAAGLLQAAEPVLQKSDYVAIVGDSITEQTRYSVFMEDYLLMCQPVENITATQFGWGGETAGGYARRMANDTLRFKPTVATTCFGMNDGGYSPMTEDKGNNYRKNQKNTLDQFKKGGVRTIILGSPGAVDLDTFRNNPELATMYNKTLAALRDIDKELAAAEGVLFADVHTPMIEAMTKAKAKYGKQYHVCGGDGFHPDNNGHLIMAYAFLKAMGFDGNIGTITLDLSGGKAEATPGHKVLSMKDDTAEIESSRYPFCFYGEPAQTSSTRGIIEFFPFNDDLNRFTLVVKGAKADTVKVTWGAQTKEFPRDQAEKGINLAAEFLENPFSEPFRKVHEKVTDQQHRDVETVKSYITRMPDLARRVPAEKDAVERINNTLVEERKSGCVTTKDVPPVKHTIKVEG